MQKSRLHPGQLRLFETEDPTQESYLERFKTVSEQNLKPTARSLSDVKPESSPEGIGNSVLITFLNKRGVSASVRLDETVTPINHGSDNFDHSFNATVVRNSAKHGQRLGSYNSGPASYSESELPEMWQEIKEYIESRNNTLEISELDESEGPRKGVYVGTFTVSRRNPFRDRPSTED